jgi:hypothetical protein
MRWLGNLERIAQKLLELTDLEWNHLDLEILSEL